MAFGFNEFDFHLMKITICMLHILKIGFQMTERKYQIYTTFDVLVMFIYKRSREKTVGMPTFKPSIYFKNYSHITAKKHY